MPYYRLFFLNREEHVVHAEVVASPSDAEIENVVRRLLATRPAMDCPALDVWQADRLVGRMTLAPETGSGTAGIAGSGGPS